MQRQRKKGKVSVAPNASSSRYGESSGKLVLSRGMRLGLTAVLALILVLLFHDNHAASFSGKVGDGSELTDKISGQDGPKDGVDALHSGSTLAAFSDPAQGSVGAMRGDVDDPTSRETVPSFVVAKESDHDQNNEASPDSMQAAAEEEEREREARMKEEVQLRSIEISNNRQLHPRFDPNTLEYNTTVPNMIAQVSLTIEARGSGSQISVNGKVVGYGNAGKHVSQRVPLAEGSNNTITVSVTSEHSSHTATYLLHLFRRRDQADLPAHLAYLKAMEIDFDGMKRTDGILPRFDPNVLSYSAKVQHNTQILTVAILAVWPIGRFAPNEGHVKEVVATTARARVDTYRAVVVMTPVDPGSKLEFNDVPFKFEQEGSKVKEFEIDLSREASQVLVLKVVAPNGAERTYTIQAFKNPEDKRKAINETVDSRISKFKNLLPNKYKEEYGAEIEGLVQLSIRRCKMAPKPWLPLLGVKGKVKKEETAEERKKRIDLMVETALKVETIEDTTSKSLQKDADIVSEIISNSTFLFDAPARTKEEMKVEDLVSKLVGGGDNGMATGQREQGSHESRRAVLASTKGRSRPQTMDKMYDEVAKLAEKVNSEGYMDDMGAAKSALSRCLRLIRRCDADPLKTSKLLMKFRARSVLHKEISCFAARYKFPTTLKGQQPHKRQNQCGSVEGNLEMPSAAAGGGREYKTCAVVGNSPKLLESKHIGGAIDSHDAVFRLNRAPTRYFEQFVGNTTTFRVFDYKSASLLAAKGVSEGMRLPSEGEKWVFWDYQVFSQEIGARDKNVLDEIRAAFGSAPSYVVLSPELINWEVQTYFAFIEQATMLGLAPRSPYSINKFVFRKPQVLSTGVHALLLAHRLCQKVNVFGFSLSPYEILTDYQTYFTTTSKARQRKGKESGQRQRKVTEASERVSWHFETQLVRLLHLSREVAVCAY